MDRGEFDECLKSDRHADEVTRNLRFGESMGVNSTPTLMLNGQILTVRTFTELEAVVMQAAGLPLPSADSAAVAAPPAG
jgi:protein-disulfide isomerase